jgi:copper homeostasis protein CutC
LCLNSVPRVLTQGGKLNITKNYENLANIIQKSI